MRKVFVLCLVVALFLTACGSRAVHSENAEKELNRILETFPLAGGVVYSERADAPYILTDAMKARMFACDGELSALAGVRSAAMAVTRRFSAYEIVVFELYDRSHRAEVMRLCRARAEKKKNAAVYADGVYVYLICTEQNDAIVDFLR